MIRLCNGDMFESGAQTLVCPVNTVGVMGCGLAINFSQRYKGIADAYRKALRDGIFDEKGFFIFEISDAQQVLCFPTKHHWSNPSKMEWITEGLAAVRGSLEECNITSIAFPAIGCGKGQLSWEKVKPAIIHFFEDAEIPVYIFEPDTWRSRRW